MMTSLHLRLVATLLLVTAAYVIQPVLSQGKHSLWAGTSVTTAVDEFLIIIINGVQIVNELELVYVLEKVN